MKKFLAVFSIFFSVFLLENQSSKASTNLTPYQSVVLASAVNYCGAEYGYITDKQAFDYIVSWVKKEHGLEPYQIYNLMNRKSWGKDTDNYIDKAGGCKKITELVLKSLDSKPTGFQSLTNTKKDYEYYYNIGL
tara:strand:+ start:2079 stop:2480 length:402 start_codon:yes stop_codon:yes gene_type:complete